MRAERVNLAIASVFMMLTISLVVFTTPAGGDSPAPGWTDRATDLTVGYGQIASLDNQSINMNASIHVYGTLYINNTWIRFGGESDGEFGFYVYSGASLYMKDSNITAYDKDTYHDLEYDFWGIGWVFNIQGHARIQRTDLSYMWGKISSAHTIDETYGGLQLLSTGSHDVLVEDVKIFNTENTGIIVAPAVFSVAHDGDPVIRRTSVWNISGVGLIGIGQNVKMDVQNSSFTDCDYKGANFYYGATGIMKNNSFNRNFEFGASFDPTSTSYDNGMKFYDCHFDNNVRSGYAARREGTSTFYRCTFNNNGEFGIAIKWESAISADTNQNKNYIYGGTANHNGLDGVGSNLEETYTEIHGMEIAHNGRYGVKSNTPAMTVNLYDCDIHDNAAGGVIYNGSKGMAQGCEIYDNGEKNGISVINSSPPLLSDNDIHDQGTGIFVQNSAPSIDRNTISECNLGLDLYRSVPASLMDNLFDQNPIGIQADQGFALTGNTIIGGTTGLYLMGAKGMTADGLGITSSVTGIRIENEGSLHASWITMANLGTAIDCFDSVVVVENSTFSSNTVGFKLDEGSVGEAVNTTIAFSNIQILDSASVFKNYLIIDLHVINNATLEDVSQPTLTVYDKDASPVLEVLAGFDGWTRGQRVLEYMLEGTKLDDNNPLNITVTKNGYVPYWVGPQTYTSWISMEVELALNHPPIWLDANLSFMPVATHQRRPTITWNASWDWNNDVIRHRLNIYQDEIIPENIIVEDAIVRQYYVNDDPAQGRINPTYTFDRNLRYNHIFYVVIETFDPWGLSSEQVCTFRTVNTRPGAPVISVDPDPASNIDDITVTIVNHSEDADTDPLDIITYYYEFWIFRGGSWTLQQSGTDNVLSADLTRENDRVRVVVKPFDGSEYGVDTRTEIDVLNFEPVALLDYVEIEMTEDEPGMDLVDLGSYFYDKDMDDLSFHVIRDNYLTMEIDSVTGSTVITPDPDFFGDDYILVEARDGKLHPNLVWPFVQINVSVLSVNDPPTMVRVNDINYREGKIIDITGTQGSKLTIVPIAEDPDVGDVLTFSNNMVEAFRGRINSSQIAFEPKTGLMEFVLTNDLVGLNAFNISVSDEAGSTQNVIVRLNIENINDVPTPPRITTPTNNQVFNIERESKISFMADPSDDPDLYIPGTNERLKYIWDFGDGSIDDKGLMDEEGNLIAEHEYRAEGNYIVTLTTYDVVGIAKSHSINIKVNLTSIVVDPPEDPETQFWEYLPFIILGLIVLLGVIGVLIFIFRREPLEDIAATEEKHHEDLMASQQAEAQKAQEMLAQMMGAAAGPALPSAPQQMEALPAAPEGVPMEGQPMQAEPMQPYPSEPMAAPAPAEPMMAPEPAPPMYDAPQTYDAGTMPETPPEQPAPTYLPPQDEQ